MWCVSAIRAEWVNLLMPKGTFIYLYLIYSFKKQKLQAANTDF